MNIPNVQTAVLAKASEVWNHNITTYGSDVVLKSADGQLTRQIKAWPRRPKIMGLFDRTEQSYDQERYVLLCRASDFDDDIVPEKFSRAIWDNEDHVFISTTKVELSGVVFGYRILVKG